MLLPAAHAVPALAVWPVFDVVPVPMVQPLKLGPQQISAVVLAKFSRGQTVLVGVWPFKDWHEALELSFKRDIEPLLRCGTSPPQKPASRKDGRERSTASDRGRLCSAVQCSHCATQAGRIAYSTRASISTPLLNPRLANNLRISPHPSFAFTPERKHFLSYEVYGGSSFLP